MAERGYECEYCSASFHSYYSLRSHVNGGVVDGIPQCVRIGQRRPNFGGDGIATLMEGDVTSDSEGNVITTPADLQHDICRRHQDDSILGAPQPLRSLGVLASGLYTGSVNYGALIAAFHAYCRWVLGSRSKKFWKLYLATRHLPQDDQKNILGLVHKLLGIKSKKTWCTDKRSVRYLLSTKPFWPLVTYTYTCDLTAFEVPGLGVVTYKFLDPIFAWIMQARKLCEKYELVFRYREAHTSSGEQTWGSCVSCGEVMRQVDFPCKCVSGNL